jgi:Uma2 family endonuclease
MTDVLQPSSAPDWAPELPADFQPHMTWDQYLAWDHECIRAEWVDGEVVIAAPMRVSELFLAQFLYELFMRHVERNVTGYVLIATFLMRLPERPSARTPDLMFLSAEHKERLTDFFIDGPADLVVEVIAPDSDGRDRSTKFVEYEAGGVPEYWLLDPLRREAYFYVLGEDGRYHLAPIAPDGVYHSHVLNGFRLQVDWLWRIPLPEPDEALAELPD